MTELDPPSERTLIERICCCCYRGKSKEPPVQLIKSGTLQAAPKINGHISTAEQTIDSLDDVILDDRQTADRSHSRVLPEEKTSDAFIMNDIMMDEIIGEDKTDEFNAVIEDAVSISTNVVEEVDESELSRLRLQFQRQSSEEQHDQYNSELELSPVEVKENVANTSVGLPKNPVTPESDNESTSSNQQKSTKPRKKTNDIVMRSKQSSSESQDEVDEVLKRSDQNTTKIEEQSPAKSKPDVASSDLEEDGRNSVGPCSSATTMEEDTTESEDEIMVDDVPSTKQQLSFHPPSVHTRSMMYADTTSDDSTSEDEDRHETVSSIQRSQKIVNIQKILNNLSDSQQDGDLSTSDYLRKNTVDAANANDDNQKKTKNEEVKKESGFLSENDNNSQLKQYPSVITKMNSDGRDAITDEEFSEKLI